MNFQMKANLTNLILRIFWSFESLPSNFDMTVNLRQEVASLTQKKLGRNRIFFFFYNTFLNISFIFSSLIQNIAYYNIKF